MSTDTTPTPSSFENAHPSNSSVADTPKKSVPAKSEHITQSYSTEAGDSIEPAVSEDKNDYGGGANQKPPPPNILGFV